MTRRHHKPKTPVGDAINFEITTSLNTFFKKSSTALLHCISRTHYQTTPPLALLLIVLFNP
jgi:hypothetical protein